MAQGSYAPADQVCTVNGVPITGFAEGTFATVSWKNDVATLKVGADNHAAVSYKKGMGACEIAFKLLATSAANGYLSSLLHVQTALGTATPLTVHVVDAQSGESALMPRGAFKVRPGQDRAEEAGEREWVFIGLADANYNGNEV